MTNYDSYSQRGGDVIAATFADRDDAKKALHELHEAGFRQLWLGITRGDAATAQGLTVESEPIGGSFMDSVGRFFTGEGPEEQALRQALVAHGLSETQAGRLESALPVGSAVVTVEGENDPTEAIEILTGHGGVISSGESPSTLNTATAPPLNTAQRSLDADPAQRLQLREERLLVDKQRVSSGEARISKEIKSEQQSVEVPVFHEELFIQRRPVNGTAVSTALIGDTEEIVIPLSEERVDVKKVTVVTEEVEIGTRRIEGTEHVSDTIRHEELHIDDGAITAGVNADRPLPR